MSTERATLLTKIYRKLPDSQPLLSLIVVLECPVVIFPNLRLNIRRKHTVVEPKRSVAIKPRVTEDPASGAIPHFRSGLLLRPPVVTAVFV